MSRTKLLPSIGAPADYFHETELREEGSGVDVDDVAEGEQPTPSRHACLAAHAGPGCSPLALGTLRPSSPRSGVNSLSLQHALTH